MRTSPAAATLSHAEGAPAGGRILRVGSLSGVGRRGVPFTRSIDEEMNDATQMNRVGVEPALRTRDCGLPSWVLARTYVRFSCGVLWVSVLFAAPDLSTGL